MAPDGSKLRIVVLDSFYDSWQEDRAQTLLPRILTLKLRGYLKEYPYGTLPIDTSDLICKHYTVCREKGDELQPVMGYKLISASKCRVHNVNFPALTILGNEGMPEYRSAIHELLGSARDRNVEMLYGGGWTIEPSIRASDKELSRLLRELFVGINILSYTETPGAELITTGTLRFKTEILFQRSLGFDQVAWKGQPLAPFKQAFLNGEPVALMHSRGVPASAKPLAEPFEQMWQERLVISGAEAAQVIKRAA